MRIPSLYLCISTLIISTACSGDKNTESEQEQEEVEETDVGPDLDGDGIADENDLDADGDGVNATEDCDDTDAAVLSNAEDLDCDGVPDTEDTDQDGDGIDASIDCDDRNPDARRALHVTGIAVRADAAEAVLHARAAPRRTPRQ